MEQSNAYVYACQPRQRSPSTASSRSGGTYQNSSAFSASANPDEDWTKISDLAERRRIQNRIAQRNYRKKLKRRLEDLERRTTSSSASPEQSHRELSKETPSEMSESERMRRRASAPRASIILQEQQQPTNLLSLEDAWMSQAPSTKTTFPFSTASAYSFPDSYPSTAEYFPDQFHSLSFNRLPMSYTNSSCAPECAPLISPAMPSMMPSDNYKLGQQDSGIDLLTPFNLNYASLAGFNIPTPDGSVNYTTRVNNPAFLYSHQYRPRSHSNGL